MQIQTSTLNVKYNSTVHCPLLGIPYCPLEILGGYNSSVEMIFYYINKSQRQNNKILRVFV